MKSEIIDTSLDAGTIEISTTFVGSLSVKAEKDGEPLFYDGKDIRAVETIDEDAFRSGGKAAVGAIIGGVLTGGLGLIAGAAVGGRKRHSGTFLIVFNDGEHIAFKDARKAVVKYMNDAGAKARIKNKLSK